MSFDKTQAQGIGGSGEGLLGARKSRRRKWFLENNVKLPVLDPDFLLEAFREAGIKEKHAGTVWRYVVRKEIKNFTEIPNLSKAAYDLLEKRFALCTSRVISKETSKDLGTTKMLIELADGKQIESVIMRYGAVDLATFPEKEREKYSKALEELARVDQEKGEKMKMKTGGAAEGSTGTLQGIRIEHTNDHPSKLNSPTSAAFFDDAASLVSSALKFFKSNPRGTLCISSQVGCAMGCKFCATGTMKWHGDLLSGEMLEQAWLANKIEPIRNVVFMGMGEPLMNCGEVIDGIRGLVDPRRFCIASHRITVSTVGVPLGIRRLMREAPLLSLALSLHAPSQELRQQIVPTASKWPLNQIMDAVDNFYEVQKAKDSAIAKTQKILYEYVLIADVNDSAEVAEQLAELLKPRISFALLNIIPYNETDVDASLNYKTPSQDRIDTFLEIVRKYGITATVRQEFGTDISAACGQLAVKSLKGGEQGVRRSSSFSSASSTGPEHGSHLEELEGSASHSGADHCAALEHRTKPTGTSSTLAAAEKEFISYRGPAEVNAPSGACSDNTEHRSAERRRLGANEIMVDVGMQMSQVDLSTEPCRDCSCCRLSKKGSKRDEVGEDWFFLKALEVKTAALWPFGTSTRTFVTLSLCSITALLMQRFFRRR